MRTESNSLESILKHSIIVLAHNNTNNNCIGIAFGRQFRGYNADDITPYASNLYHRLSCLQKRTGSLAVAH